MLKINLWHMPVGPLLTCHPWGSFSFFVTIMRKSCLVGAIVLGSLGVGATPVGAQSKDLDRVVQLNRRAVDHYNHLQMRKARKKLNRARRIARRAGLTGAAPARTHVCLGMIDVTEGKLEAAKVNFTRALHLHGSIELDPLMSTPEIEAVFNDARQQLGRQDSEPVSAGSGSRREPFEGNIPHLPVPEQLVFTALPVFVEVPKTAPVSTLILFYRGRGMVDYRPVRMKRIEGGFGYEIPCADVLEAHMDYYMVAYDKKRRKLGFVGTPDKPVQVPIVSVRQHAAPMLPGRPPPERCSADECEPGTGGCGGEPEGKREGEACRATAECQPGMTCEEGFCADGGYEPSHPHEEDMPRFFAHLGFTLGFSYVSSGMFADGTGTDPAFVPEGDENCKDNGDAAQDFCVRVANPGFVPTYALRVTAGYYVWNRLALAGSIRFQPNAGQGDLANWLFSARAQYLFTPMTEKGLNISTFVGTGFGQIQPQPAQSGSVRPFVRSGLHSLDLGGTLGWRFTRNIGLFFTPEVRLMVPLFLFHIDTTAGIELAF